jgi:hypothetical protein
MPYDPTQAGDPVPPEFHNTVRCVANEIITINEAVARGRYFKGLPERTTGDEPYWDFLFQALNRKWARDDSFMSWKAGGKLYNVSGARMDNTRHPYRMSMAFAGLRTPECPSGISVFPGDPEGKLDAWCAANCTTEDDQRGIGINPNFDPSKIIDRVFEVKIEKMEYGDDLPLPLIAHPEGYIFTGEVKTVGSASDDGMNPDGAAAPNPADFKDITKPGGEELRKQTLDLINGAPVEADLFEVLRVGGLDSTAQFEGESVVGAAVNGEEFVRRLTAHGYITVTDGRIAVST